MFEGKIDIFLNLMSINFLVRVKQWRYFFIWIKHPENYGTLAKLQKFLKASQRVQKVESYDTKSLLTDNMALIQPSFTSSKWNMGEMVKGVSIFQTFWKIDSCPDFLFLELKTSNFGYLIIFLFPLNVQTFSKIGQHWY